MRRRDGHWATIKIAAYSAEANIYATAYTALDAVLDLLALRKQYDAGFSYPSALTMFHAYTSELYRFDQLYRLFHEAADTVEMAGWDVLKPSRPVWNPATATGIWTSSPSPGDHFAGRRRAA